MRLLTHRRSFLFLLLGPGGAAGAAALLLHRHMVGLAGFAVVVTTPGVIAADLGLGVGRSIVGGHVTVGLVVAVAAADRIVVPRVVDADAAQAAGSRLVVAAILLGTIQIAHTNTSGVIVTRQRQKIRSFFIFLLTEATARAIIISSHEQLFI